jgi:hypothetical protein
LHSVFEPQNIGQGLSGLEMLPSRPRFKISCSIFEIQNMFRWVLAKNNETFFIRCSCGVLPVGRFSHDLDFFWSGTFRGNVRRGFHHGIVPDGIEIGGIQESAL